MEAALGNSKDYSLKQYLSFANTLQEKAKVCQKIPLLAMSLIKPLVFCIMYGMEVKFIMFIIDFLESEQPRLISVPFLLVFLS